MKFLVEDSLTKLAKKLRLMGFDTEICTRSEISEASRDREVFLTKSKKSLEIAWKNKIKCYLIKSENWKSQLRSVIQRFKIDANDVHFLSRCSKCNGMLVEASPNDLTDVPEYVALTKARFCRCIHCGQVYWDGSHVEHIKLMNSFLEKSGGRTEEI
ncbi:MAG: Mut7-C RNAse domain-containing protein [Mesotoga sp.]|jgi:hypothetical protein|uniref:Mut7-C RNAse domain-containing protein n=1 Tax=unclassified Mesotoga TaxID=1184398 RepID=UPI000EF23ADF|nr:MULTISPECIES: Mut7-C RNAse domain-containing protein [unclassified Mesotoga]NLT45200.1 hypothetical protein [Thermotogaceae bacterium]MDD2332951.1 Mut7-C RNAse domain-containing protein [Mesotoga sp.]MDD3680149.1 Mut7-C RNAse domain-containing protein [Mesotoga sp.]MDD4206390.1 Mut7-C RNAse domain-containing protein [Mesotoga sp.]MDD4824685.1 Mut7-C RNAse domain-containing protein [Mesotoga sp.]